MKVRITQAGAADVDAIRTLQRVCLPGEILVDPAKDAWWIGRDERGVAVCFAGARVYRAHDEHALLLTSAGVIPSARGKGLQRRLIAARLRYAQQLAIPYVWTYTATSNRPSSNNLIRSGFTLWKPTTWAGESTDSDAWLYWSKRLIKPAPKKTDEDEKEGDDE